MCGIFNSAILDKLIFENFRAPFYDDVIYKNDSFLWSNKELKIKAEDLSFRFRTFWN